LEVVNNTVSQWCFRTDNDKFNMLFSGGFRQRLFIARVNIQVMGNESSPGIARSDVNLFNFRALSQLPD